MISYNENTITVLKDGYTVYDFTTGEEVFFNTLEECKNFIDTFLYID